MKPINPDDSGPPPPPKDRILYRCEHCGHENNPRRQGHSSDLSNGGTFFNDDDDDEKEDKKETEITRRPSTSAGTSIQVSLLLGNNSEIEYQYLTFDTILPVPNISNEGNGPPIPESPDFSRYADPLRWPRARKNIMVAVSCLATLFTAYTAGAYSPPIDLIAEELHTTHEVALLGLTTFCLGFAYAPMILAPFSEINGRYPVFAIAGVLFTVFQALCGVVTTVPGMLLVRLFKGASGSVFSTMVGGVISDLYGKEARNTPMALFSGCVLIGTGLGPLISSVIVENSAPGSQTWKWVFWHQAIVDFVLMIAVVTLFKESRGSVILSKKARALNKWYDELEQMGYIGVWVQEAVSPRFFLPSTPGSPMSPMKFSKDGEKRLPASVRPSMSTEGLTLRRIRWKTKEDEARGSVAAMISVSLTRPFHLLFTEPIVFFFSLWVSFAWAVLYLTFGSIPIVFRRQYNFTIEQSGYVFAAMIVASTIATVFGILQDHALKHPSWQAGATHSPTYRGGQLRSQRIWTYLTRKFPSESPESRLYLTCIAGSLLPIGLFLFGFSAQPSIHWIVPTVAIGLATAGIYYVYLATFNYLADIYQAYASSALAAQSFCRNVLGGVFPLVTAMLFTNLGEDAAGGVLGAIATVLAAVPWVLVFFGERIRRRSKYAVALQK
ncbi:major facilitator superfamily domain-containing protein [Nemania sp. FL0916]|nr:major facilitator superfamily domain-containing protein [Nemania sp. FL0916]